MTSFVLTTIFRLVAWYVIITVLFLCPPSQNLLDASSPRVCKYYFTAETYVRPHLQPYYDAYASRYVEKAQPYLSAANDRALKPVTAVVVKKYQKYAEPRVVQARKYAQSLWETNALPRLKWAQESALQAYEENLAPQVLKVSEVATPYYESAKESALTAHEKHIVPAIAYSQPHLDKMYATVRKFTLEKAVPFVQHAWMNFVAFVNGTLWPFVRKVYGDNVHPQLVMIGERIAKYQEGRQIRSAMELVNKSTASDPTSTKATATSENILSSIATAVTSSSTSESHTSATSNAPQPPRVATDQTISEDLVKWQKKFAIAADKGTDDLKERIEEIVARIVKNDFPEGQRLATALKKTCAVQLGTMKAKIKSVVSLLPKDAQAAETATAESKIVKAIQEAGQEIKTRAKAVRSWRETCRQEFENRTELATESTLYVLDDIRDLGLQEIGMRWAWMEGVTYKHWQKYHELKRRFADWRSEVREAALSHPALLDALEEVNKVWEESMAVTEDAARELIRLKDVAKWKVAARDSSDDFDSRAIPVVAAAASAASSVASSIKGAVTGSSQDTMESVPSVASGSAASLADEGYHGAESILSNASPARPSSQGTFESSVDKASSTGSSIASEASIAASSASSVVFSATTGSVEGTVSSVSSLVDSISLSAASGANEAGASQSLLDAVNKAGEKAAEVSSSWASN